MMIKRKFGLNLKKLREDRGWTAKELSLRSGVHESTISRLERESGRYPHLETFILLADGFQMTLDEFALHTRIIDGPRLKHLVIQDPLVAANLHLLTHENLQLLKILEKTDQKTRYHLTQFIVDIKKDITAVEQIS